MTTAKCLIVNECVFCGATENLTRDHIPPDNLFPDPKPKNPITVTSCDRCNAGSSKDDTYFRDTLLFMDVTKTHPEARKVSEKVIRSFQRPEQTKYSHSFLDNVKNYDLFSPSGLYIGKALGKPLDHSRINKTTAKIVKGLFSHEFGQRLPDHCEAKTFLLGNQRDHDKQRFFEKIIANFMAKPRITIGDDVFSYWFHRFEDHPERSCWLLLFYEKIPLLGLTLEKDYIQNNSM